MTARLFVGAPVRGWRLAVATAVLISCVMSVVVLTAGQARAAASTYGMTITSIAPKKIAALTANQSVTLTGTNFDSAVISSVHLGPCENSTWIVVNSTTLVVQTPNATCGVATPSTTVPETITITDVDSNTLAFTGTATTGLFFIAPATLDSTNPIYVDNSANLATKVKKARSGGGQLVRIVAAADYTFTAGVTATLGGSPITGIAIGGGNVPGNYITGTTPARPDGSTTLVVTANGVSKSVTSATTGFTYWSPPTLTAVTPNNGKAVATGDTGANVVLTGTGFSTVAAENTVTFCGKTATVKTSPAPTTTSLSVNPPDPAFGTGVYEGICPVVVTVGGNASAITALTKYAYLTQ